MVFSALTIAGSDSGGGAGIQADLKTFQDHRVHGLCVITSLTAQNTTAVRDVSDVPLDFIKAQFDAVHEDFEIGAAKTGMLSTIEIIEAVVKNLGDYPLVVDPVMVAESGARLLKKDAVETIKEKLLPRAMVATPNRYEAEILADVKIEDLEDMKEACRRISSLGCSVVVKGGHLNAVDLLYLDGDFHMFEGELLEGSFHGSGCTFSAAVATNLAKGFNLRDAVANSKNYMTGALKASYTPGRGKVRVVNQMRSGFEEKSDEVTRRILGAVYELENMEGLHRLFPEVGMNICYGREGAKNLGDVAGVSGRIIRAGDRIVAVGGVEYGASRHIGKVVLSAMEKDGEMRAALNIKYRPEIIEAIKKNGSLSISFFDREKEPERVSSMEWGTLEAINSFGGVPDLIYDRGGVGKEPMIRILGRDPAEVVDKLRRIIGMRYEEYS